jgi:hypothetical protein
VEWEKYCAIVKRYSLQERVSRFNNKKVLDDWLQGPVS